MTVNLLQLPNLSFPMFLYKNVINDDADPSET